MQGEMGSLDLDLDLTSKSNFTCVVQGEPKSTDGVLREPSQALFVSFTTWLQTGILKDGNLRLFNSTQSWFLYTKAIGNPIGQGATEIVPPNS
jgi:hypothetical protein